MAIFLADKKRKKQEIFLPFFVNHLFVFGKYFGQ
jgi:hypothetical protein